MFKVTKHIEFCYGHRLLNYEGKCRHLHGHNGRVEVDVEADKLDARGMVYDFSDIKATIKNWIDETLDHRMLLSKDDPVLPALRGATRSPYAASGSSRSPSPPRARPSPPGCHRSRRRPSPRTACGASRVYRSRMRWRICRGSTRSPRDGRSASPSSGGSRGRACWCSKTGAGSRTIRGATRTARRWTPGWRSASR